MRMVKLVFISVVVLFIVLTFVFSLFPAHIRISRVINISASKEKIAQAVNELNTWKEWNSLLGTSSESIQTVSNPSSGAGAYILSSGMRVMITSSNTDSILTSWLQNDRKPFTGGFNIVQSQQGSADLEWFFNFHFRWYPWEKLASIFYDKQLGPLMEKSLINLKKYIENH